jgi:hypothetical protein
MDTRNDCLSQQDLGLRSVEFRPHHSQLENDAISKPLREGRERWEYAACSWMEAMNAEECDCECDSEDGFDS